MVLDNIVMFGTVNANRRHWELAEQSLSKADKTWLSKLVSRRVPLSQWEKALERDDNDIKVVIDFAA
jgi:threonine dehydrogenase-like Zn-dependent dehydrogenase